MQLSSLRMRTHHGHPYQGRQRLRHPGPRTSPLPNLHHSKRRQRPSMQAQFQSNQLPQGRLRSNQSTQLHRIMQLSPPVYRNQTTTLSTRIRQRNIPPPITFTSQATPTTRNSTLLQDYTSTRQARPLQRRSQEPHRHQSTSHQTQCRHLIIRRTLFNITQCSRK